MMNFSITNQINSPYDINKIPSEKLFSHVADWRIVSSGVVTRSCNLISNDPIEDSSTSKESITSENDFLQHSLWTDSLRKPIRYHKVKKNPEDDYDKSKMTKNCEHLFTQMKSSFSLPKTKNDADPSFSVRRIVKDSGLLGSFGPGLLRNDGNDHQTKPVVRNEPETNLEFNSKGTQPFDVNAFLNAPVQATQVIPDLWQKDSSLNDEGKYDNGFDFESLPKRSSKPDTYHGYHSSSLPFMYDTVLMQKTIETEVVEYLPYEDDDASPPQKRHITGKKTVLYTPASNNFATVREQEQKYEKLQKSKEQLTIEARYEDSSESSDGGSKSCSSEF